MIPLLIFLYCCASITPVPTPYATWETMKEMVHLLYDAPLKFTYDEDPLMMVWGLHAELDPHAANVDVDALVSRWGGRDADVSSRVWGPAAWKMLHDLASSVHHGRVRRLLDVWVNLLPCEQCRTHLRTHLAVSPPPPPSCSTPESSFKYTVCLHNAVNVYLKKSPVFPSTQDDANEKICS